MTPRQTTATIILLALLAFQLAVLANLAIFPYVPNIDLILLNIQIYALLQPLSTVLLLGLLYMWLVKFATTEARHRSTSFNRLVQSLSQPFSQTVSQVQTLAFSESANRFLPRPRLLLPISLVISVLLALVPYRPDLGRPGVLVGVDSPLYLGWIIQMLARPLPQALAYSFVGGLEGSRPLLLIPLYLVASAGVSPNQILEYLPTVLAPLLSLSTYLFVRYGQGSTGLAGLAALFSPVSFYTTVGLWGGYYANWLGLTLAYLFMTMLLVYSETPSRLNYAMMYALSIALFLTHPWTWVLLATVSLVFAITLWRETRTLIHLVSVLVIIVSVGVLDLVKSWIFATRGVGVDVAGTFESAGLVQLASFWPNLVQALLYTHGGLLGDWLILGLGLLAASALRFKNRFERLLTLWIGVASVPFALLDSYHQARIVYDLPIPVLMSVAAIFFLPSVGSRTLRWPGMVIILLAVAVTDYALQGILFL